MSVRRFKKAAIFIHAKNCPTCHAKIIEIFNHAKPEYEKLLQKVDFYGTLTPAQITLEIFLAYRKQKKETKQGSGNFMG